jgi:hypothetical protein
MHLKSFGRPNEAAISEFEQHLGSSLPEDYRAFLLATNGGSLPASGFHVPELNRDCRLDVLFGFNLPPALSLDAWQEEMDEELPAGSAIIGSDPRSGLILLGWQELPGVYFYDHAHRFQTSSEEHNTYWIANSWSEFVAGLLSGDAPQETPLSGGVSAFERLTLAQVPDPSEPDTFELVDRLVAARFSHQEAVAYSPPE